VSPRPHRTVRAARGGLAALFLAALSSWASAGPSRPPHPSLALSPCTLPGLEGEARCGTYSVFENRATQRGRRIALKIVLLPATGPERSPDPLVFFSGGPGEAATETAPDLARNLGQIRRRRDILLIDQRGTGGSHPLLCPLFGPPENLQSYLEDFFPPEAVRKCRKELEADADLTLYTTPIAVEDVDEVRAALGLSRINIVGGSYGTRAALAYLKRHSSHVRSVVLMGAVPTGARMPLAFARHAERALAGVLSECAQDASCRQSFPNARSEVRSVLEELGRSPARVSISGPGSPSPVTVTLSRDLAAEAIRYLLYQPAAARRIPAVVHRAAIGDFVPLATSALHSRKDIVDSGSNGLYLSVTCAEDVPWIAPGEGERAAAGTFLGDYRLRQQRAACALWPRGQIPAGYLRPVRSATPVLILSGAWDPVTPPSEGAAVAKRLSRSLHVVVPHGAHGFDGLQGVDCLDRLITAFIERGAVKGLETECVGRIQAPAFALEP
jgi:pimeloyl-ACP methyl ester carboxylesterase